MRDSRSLIPQSRLLLTAASRSSSAGEPHVILDGANLLWAHGHALSRRFGCKIYPSAAGLFLALEYEPWKRAGVRVTALLPSNYVHGPLLLIADGCGGDMRHLQPDRVEQTPSGEWTNIALARAVQQGRIQLVTRSNGAAGRGDDDREIIRAARAQNGYVCSNDLFREHRKLRGKDVLRQQGVGVAHLFRNKQRFKEWQGQRRFGCAFTVAPGLPDKALLAMAAAQAQAVESAAGRVVPSEQALRTMLQTAPWRLPVPVVFEPRPSTAMLAAHSALLQAAERRGLSAEEPAVIEASAT